MKLNYTPSAGLCCWAVWASVVSSRLVVVVNLKMLGFENKKSDKNKVITRHCCLSCVWPVVDCVVLILVLRPPKKQNKQKLSAEKTEKERIGGNDDSPSFAMIFLNDDW